MRRLLLVLLFSIAGYAQTTTTVTGTIKDLSGSVVTSGQVTFQLQPGLDTTISGSARFSPSIVTCGISGAGAIKALDLVSACTVTYNTALVPQNSYYKVCIQANFVAGGACFNWYALVSSFDLTTAVPTPGTAPAFTFVDLISAQTISGNKTFSGANSFSGVNTFSGIPVFSSGISGTAGQTLGLPSVATTLVGNDNAVTLTNKTLTAPVVTSPSTTGTDSGVETLASKTISAGAFTGTETHSGQIQSSLATGTAPFSIASTTPVANLSATPTSYNAAGTQQANTHVVFGTCTLGTNCAVTLVGSAAFSLVTSYQCTASDGSAANAVLANITAANAVTFTGTGTDLIRYICVGN